MKISVSPGTYVLAVSGGVDSMVLLDVLAKQPKLNLVVAHYDHGIRPDSDEDKQLVQQTAQKLGLPFVFDQGNLGKDAGEAVAREARYKFLNKVKQASNAKAIITAHHQDDVIETAIINLMRGTNRKGLTSLQNTEGLVRPLLKIPKSEIIKYAKANNIVWHEDSTNQDEAYLRNYIRRQIVPKLSAAQKTQLLGHIDKLSQLNKDIDSILAKQLKAQDSLDRHWFVMLDHAIARDVLATWLKDKGIKDLDKKRLEILVRAAKTYQSGKMADVDKNYILEVKADKLALSARER
jgi:tRNA(Ile)-lysidine synthase